MRDATYDGELGDGDDGGVLVCVAETLVARRRCGGRDTTRVADSGGVGRDPRDLMRRRVIAHSGSSLFQLALCPLCGRVDAVSAPARLAHLWCVVGGQDGLASADRATFEGFYCESDTRVGVRMISKGIV